MRSGAKQLLQLHPGDIMEALHITTTPPYRPATREAHVEHFNPHPIKARKPRNPQRNPTRRPSRAMQR